MTCKHNISLDTETSAEHQVPRHHTFKHTTLESVLKFQNCLCLPSGPRPKKEPPKNKENDKKICV